MMYIARIDRKNPSKKVLKKAISALCDGGLVVFPTETAYGLACDAMNVMAVRKIFKVKRRDKTKPLPLIAGTGAMARKTGFFHRMTKRLTRDFWPGPLTVVIPGVPGYPKGIMSRVGDIAVRVSSNSIASALSRGLGRPIVSTSANRSGRPHHYDVPSVIAELGDVPDVILDAGRLPEHVPSTIVRCGEEECEILREGSITIEKLVKSLSRCR